MVNSKPYIEEFLGSNIWRRTFKTDLKWDDLKWHFDEEDRIVEVESGTGWQFQFDNKLPYYISKGDIIKIPKGVYHRIIASNINSPLVVKIKKMP